MTRWVVALENRSLSGLWLWTQWVVALDAVGCGSGLQVTRWVVALDHRSLGGLWLWSTGHSVDFGLTWDTCHHASSLCRYLIGQDLSSQCTTHSLPKASSIIL